jgi:hypothetical protein
VRPGWPSKTRSKTRLQHVDFCFFFTKSTLFWFFLKKNDPGNPVTRSKPGTRILDRAGSKNYAREGSFPFSKVLISCLKKILYSCIQNEEKKKEKNTTSIER